MNWVRVAALVLWWTIFLHAAAQQTQHVQLFCHRTANQDVPENTLESLRQAALLGCDAVEVDVRRTLDGRLILNHDGFLERLTDGIGQVEDTYFEDLRLRDAGGWMGSRFKGIRIPLFTEALHLAKDVGVDLILDLKDKAIGEEVLRDLQREDMLEHVRFGGEWDDIKPLLPSANQNDLVWVQPGVTATQISAYHRQGKRVVVNFSATDRAMDIDGMKTAVAMGTDAINVDYPRLGTDAVGRPVEQKLKALTLQAEAGDRNKRAHAVLELSQYVGFHLQNNFAHWLLDPDEQVSRAAALALVRYRPRVTAAVFAPALRSKYSSTRGNAVWALGLVGASTSSVLPLLSDPDLRVIEQALVTLSQLDGEVRTGVLLPLLSHSDPSVRGAAALALARHQPSMAAVAISLQIKSEIRDLRFIYDGWLKRGKGELTQSEISKIVAYYRCQMKEISALSTLSTPAATRTLEQLAFRPGKDFAEMDSELAAFQLWDRIQSDPGPAVLALAAEDPNVADRATWMLVQAGPAVAVRVRPVLHSQNLAARGRAIQILAWLGDHDSLPDIRNMKAADAAEAGRIAWAISKIEELGPEH